MVFPVNSGPRMDILDNIRAMIFPGPSTITHINPKVSGLTPAASNPIVTLDNYPLLLDGVLSCLKDSRRTKFKHLFAHVPVYKIKDRSKRGNILATPVYTLLAPGSQQWWEQLRCIQLSHRRSLETASRYYHSLISSPPSALSYEDFVSSCGYWLALIDTCIFSNLHLLIRHIKSYRSIPITFKTLDGSGHVTVPMDDLLSNLNCFISFRFCGGVGFPDAAPNPDKFLIVRDNVLKYSDFFFKSKAGFSDNWATNPCISLLNRPSVNKRYRNDSHISSLSPAKRARLEVDSPVVHKNS